jgi:hypothetical protein
MYTQNITIKQHFNNKFINNLKFGFLIPTFYIIKNHAFIPKTFTQNLKNYTILKNL